MNSKGMERKLRNEYVRKMLSILLDTYMVERPKLSRAMGFRNTYIADFLRGDRNLMHETLDRIESYIFDLYKPLFVEELKIQQSFIDDLWERDTAAKSKKKSKVKK